MNALKAATLLLLVNASAEALTIDRMSTDTFGGYWQNATPSTGLTITAWPDVYHVNDGSSWTSGAGSNFDAKGWLTNETVSGGKIRYTFVPYWQSSSYYDGVLLDYDDYNSGDHSSTAVIKPYLPMILEADIGSNVATLSTWMLLHENRPANYAPPLFQYFSAPEGTLVPFVATYTLQYHTWVPGVTSFSIRYRTQGMFDFAAYRPVPEPAATIIGLGLLVLCRRGRRVAR